MLIENKLIETTPSKDKHMSNKDKIIPVVQDLPIFRQIFDLPLPKGHDKYFSQSLFKKFMNDYSQDYHLETGDFENGGGMVSIIFPGEEYIFLIDTKNQALEINELVDYDSSTFKVVENIPFDWDVLKEKMNQYANPN